MCGLKLTPVDYIRYLGMYIDKFLDWNHHIEELGNKLSRANGILSKLRYNAVLEICKQVYYSIFYSHANYGCNVWGLTTNENIEVIEVLQKKCVRILSFAPFGAHTNQLFINLNLLKLRDIIKLNQLMLVYDYYEGNLPADLMTLFRPSSEVHSTNMQLNSTIKNLIHIPTINTLTYGNRSIKYSCAKLWNEFFVRGIAIDSDRSHNISLRDIRNKQHFKTILKKHFLYNYSVEND